MKQHNNDFKKPAGKVVHETGELWEVHEVYSVQNVYVAESMFWKCTKYADIPFMGGVEIIAMKPEEVQKAMDAVLKLSNGATKVSMLAGIPEGFRKEA